MKLIFLVLIHGMVFDKNETTFWPSDIHKEPPKFQKDVVLDFVDKNYKIPVEQEEG